MKTSGRILIYSHFKCLFMYSEFQIGNYVSFENEYYKITNIQKYNDKVYFK